MSILLYNHKELTKCNSEVEQIEPRVSSMKKRLTIEEEKEEMPTTLDGFYEKLLKVKFYNEIVDSSFY